MLTTEVGGRASEDLHSQMLNSVFKAPMSFIDATPSIQILSHTVDRGVPDSTASVLYCFLHIFMSIGTLAQLPFFFLSVFCTRRQCRFSSMRQEI